MKDRDAEGWATVSAMVWPLVEKLPFSLIELQKTDDGGMIRLTHDGEVVMNWS